MYSIVREQSFDEQLELISRQYSRMAELDSAIDWALSRQPTRIPNVVRISYDYYLWVTDEFYAHDVPMVRILYRVDQEHQTIYLLAIAEVRPNEEDLFGRFTH